MIAIIHAAAVGIGSFVDLGSAMPWTTRTIVSGNPKMPSVALRASDVGTELQLCLLLSSRRPLASQIRSGISLCDSVQARTPRGRPCLSVTNVAERFSFSIYMSTRSNDLLALLRMCLARPLLGFHLRPLLSTLEEASTLISEFQLLFTILN